MNSSWFKKYAQNSGIDTKFISKNKISKSQLLNYELIEKSKLNQVKLFFVYFFIGLLKII